MSFDCCIPCKPPDRYPGCHSHCQRYIEAKAKHDQEKAIVDRKRAIVQRIDAQKIAGVVRALRRKGGK